MDVEVDVMAEYRAIARTTRWGGCRDGNMDPTGAGRVATTRVGEERMAGDRDGVWGPGDGGRGWAIPSTDAR